MKKKAIISQTILFILIIAFVVIFKSIFGDENTLIGVTTITAMLMMLQRDLTLSPIQNTFLLIGLNLFIGICTTLASLNPWLGIPINLIAMFIISYSLCYNLRSPMFLPFSLEYVFLLAFPVETSQLPMRFYSLIFGAVAIMIMQLLFNKNNITKNGNKLLSQTCSNIIEKINKKNSEPNKIAINKTINRNLSSFRTILYDKRKESFYLTEEGKLKLSISVALEKISLLVDEINFSEHSKLENSLIEALKEIKKFLDDESSIVDEHVLSKIRNYKGKPINNITVLKIISNLAFIYESFDKLKALGQKHYNLIKKYNETPYTLNFINRLKVNMEAKSINFSYAVRVSISVSIAAFIMDYFKLPQGRWLLFTALSLVQPIYELSKSKTKDRVIATIFGAILVEILFFIFKDTLARTFIIILAGYIGGFIKPYKYNMICVTVSAIGGASILSNTSEMVLSRLTFVALGAVLAIFINKLILPYNIEKDSNTLKDMYYNVIKEMLSLLDNVGIKKSRNSMDNLFIKTTLIEDRFKVNNITPSKNSNEIISNSRLLVCNIYELYLQLSIYDLKNRKVSEVIKELNKESLSKDYKDNLISYINSSDNFEEKLLLSNILEITNSIEKLQLLIK